jgi:cellulose synthase/poly-beta-1,6-N-acetylglucosamine synthase-like glycosyltransferase
MMALIGVLLALALILVVIVTVRGYLLTLNRLFGRHRQPWLDIGTAPWPRVAVFIPCRDEKEIGPLMVALLAADYPAEQLVLIPIDDPETPGTAGVVDDYAVRFPGKVVPFHRARSDGGRAGALREASEHAAGSDAPIHLVFDGVYRPGRGLLKQLIAPFFDPEVGAVFGRIVPGNGSRALLPRLLELSRAAAAQIEQQARLNQARIPEIPAPVTGVRRSALLAAGGWRSDAELETLELGYRLSSQGWEIAYQNRAECFETVPEDWPAEIREIRRIARGRTQALARFGAAAGGDGVLRLGRPLIAVVLMLAWIVALAASYTGYPFAVVGLGVLTIALHAGAGSCCTFLAVAAAARLDGSRRRVRLLPFLGMAGLAGTMTAAWATVLQLVSKRRVTRPSARRVPPAETSLASSLGKEA